MNKKTFVIILFCYIALIFTKELGELIEGMNMIYLYLYILALILVPCLLLKLNSLKRIEYTFFGRKVVQDENKN